MIAVVAGVVAIAVVAVVAGVVVVVVAIAVVALAEEDSSRPENASGFIDWLFFRQVSFFFFVKPDSPFGQMRRPPTVQQSLKESEKIVLDMGGIYFTTRQILANRMKDVLTDWNAKDLATLFPTPSTGRTARPVSPEAAPSPVIGHVRMWGFGGR